MAITSATGFNSASALTTVCNLPASVATGDLILVICGLDVGAGASTSSPSLTELKDETGTDVWAWIGYLKSPSGGETAVTLTHASEKGTYISLRIPAAEWHGTTVPEITAVGNGTSANPDPPSITPSWGSEAGTTFIAVVIADDSAEAFPITAWPTNYSQQISEFGGTSAASVAAAIRIAASSPENPSAYTMTASEHWRTYTIAVRGAAAANITVTPGIFAIVWTGFAPTVTASDHKTFTPAAFAVAWTGFAPTVTASDHKVITPSPFALAWTGFAPTVTAGAGTVITPNPFALAWTGLAPTVTTSDHKLVTPDPFVVTWTGLAPTVTVGVGQTITPVPFTIAWTGLAPSLAITDHQMITPSPFAVVWTGFAPVVNAPYVDPHDGTGPSRLQTPIGVSRGRPVSVVPYG